MGSFLTRATGLQNKYQASNPYSEQYLQGQIKDQEQIAQQQQQLADVLKAQVSGQGPNPAQTQYMQNVQKNIADTQGLISSQRGLNPALAARMGANAEASASQQGAAQSSLLNQQQQIAATQNLGNLYGQMQTGNLGYQGLYNQSASNANSINAGVAAGNQQMGAQLVGGIMKGASAAAGAMNKGGMVHGYADGGIVDKGTAPVMPQQQPQQSSVAQYLNKSNPFDMSPGGGSDGNNAASNMAAAAPMIAANKGAYIMKTGGAVPGKAKVEGNSIKNDTVPAMLSAGEIVLPRTVTQSDDAADKAKKFVAAILAKEKMRKR